MNDIKKTIEDYVYSLLYRHDLSPSRNERNKKIMDKVVERCVEELEQNSQLCAMLQNESQIQYYVRQTILYMI